MRIIYAVGARPKLMKIAPNRLDLGQKPMRFAKRVSGGK